METASVLVSEADPDVRRLLVLVIERLGHEAIVLDPDDEIPPRVNLVLVEPTSPACVDQARRARAHRPELLVVAMSALPPEAEFLLSGPLEYLEKPFTIDGLLAKLSRPDVGQGGGELRR
jgi:DNA-binding response OmpR family regulator